MGFFMKLTLMIFVFLFTLTAFAENKVNIQKEGELKLIEIRIKNLLQAKNCIKYANTQSALDLCINNARNEVKALKSVYAKLRNKKLDPQKKK
jgi:hypothetical protein